PTDEDINNQTDSKANHNHLISSIEGEEGTVNITPVAAIILTRLKQSKKVKINEKIIDKKQSLQFSAESLRLTINNEAISVHLLETKFSENISSKNILIAISSLTKEVKKNFMLKDKEKKKILTLIERLNKVLAPLPKRTLFKRTLFARKWTFLLSTPYILKIIEILSGAGIEHSKNNTNSNGTTNKMSI
ncbi:MAG TPA: hypothetical protein VJ225_05230, partial [Nitrososphaeraceae archaeon]|nr:hypothetical protein [Nitrososphaeraceae archaeon]